MQNNDKAKKILFGNKNIGADPLWDTDQAKAYENITRKLNEAGVPVKPINWHEEHERFDQINRVLDYCTENNLSPDKLIEDHKLWRRFQEHKAFKEQAKKDFGME